MGLEEPLIELSQEDDKQSPWSFLRKQFRPTSCEQRLLIAAIVICILGNKLAVLLTPVTWRYTVDALSGDNVESDLAVRGVMAYSGLAVVADAFSQLRGSLWARLSNKLTKDVSVKLFEHIHALSLRWHLNRKTGEILRIVDIGVKAVAAVVSVVAFNMGPTLLELALVSGIFMKIGVPAISLCVMASAGLYVIYTVSVTKMRTNHRRAVNDASKAQQDKAVDSLLNFETVKLFAAEATEVQEYSTTAQVFADAQTRAQDSLSALNFGQTVSMQLGMVCGLLVACSKAAASEMSVGEFVMIQLYILQIFRPLISLGSNYNSLMQAMADLERMTQLLSVQLEVKDKHSASDMREILARIPKHQRTVAFSQVCFAYEAGKPGGVENLSFVIGGGGSLALVGPSGSGKSTTTRLLCRLLDVTSGSVSIGGTDVRDVTQHSLRSCVSVVSQDTVLFNSTICFNLLYGKPDATESEVQEAMRMAQVQSFLGRMEDGLQTKVGERGLRLSGGEKQRLGIARALLTDPSVLVLDEATSALDTTTEKEVQQAINKAAEGRCTVMIAHRLSTVVAATEILVLKAGKVVERGTHQSLLQAGGLFKEMWAAQANNEDASALQCKYAVEYACCKPCSCK